MARLRITSGPSAGRTVLVQGELTLGREHADLVIDDPEVSRRHAVLRAVEGGLEVQDLGSANGTFVNGRQVNGSLRLTADARIRVGMTELALEEMAPADVTRLRPIVDPQATRVARPQTTQALGAFSPPVHRRGMGLATRSWAPAVLSYGTVVATAIALVIYFASR